MSDLLQAQIRFARMLGQLLCWAASRDMLLTVGEVWRPPETAELYAKQGRGSAHSVHCQKLAADVAVFDAAGKYLTDTGAYLALGEYWEGLGGCWGGRFSNMADPYHFSIDYNGVR